MIVIARTITPQAVHAQTVLACLALTLIVNHPPPLGIPIVFCVVVAFLCSWHSKVLDLARSAWTALFFNRKGAPADVDEKPMDNTAKYNSFKDIFATAKLIGTHRELLQKYLRRYGHRPEVAALVQRAYNDSCCKD